MSPPYPWLAAAWDRLTGAWRQSRLGHAQLLYGRAGFGKREFARDFAQLLLCETPQHDRACGRCRGCTLFEAGNHPDYLRIALLEENKTLLIDQIRELGAYYALRPHYRDTKIATIEAADTMNRAAANALLKLLEEPPAGALLLLVADRPAQLPPTVRSRCQHIALDCGAPDLILDWLAGQGATGSRATLAEGLARAAGSPLLACRLLEPARAQAVETFVESLTEVAAGALSPLGAAARTATLSLDLLLDQWLRVAYEVLLLKIGASLPLAECGRAPTASLQRLADAVNFRAVAQFIQKAQDVRRLGLGSGNLREADLTAGLWFDWQASGGALHRRRSEGRR